MLFLLIKWIHVLSAITAFGANITYGIWITRGRRKPEVMPFVLHTIKLIDDRVANPLYALLPLTGLTMAFMVPVPLTAPWLTAALVLYAIATLLGMVIFVPMFRKLIRLLESEGLDSPGYRALQNWVAAVGVLVGIAVLMIVFLMVVKPPLWG